MISYYYRTIKKKRVQTLDAPRVGVWVHAQAPTGREVAQVCATLGVAEDMVRDALDPHEVPRVEVADGVTYIFARVPQVHDDIDMSTVPILIAVGETFILTVASQHVDVLDRFTSGAVEYYTTQKTRLFLQVYSAIVAAYNRRLATIAKRVRAMSATDIGDARDLANFVATERVLNDYMSAIVPSVRVLRRLMVGNITRLTFHAADTALMEDLLVDMEQLEEVCRSTLKHAVGIRTAHATITAHSLNATMKTLTALTIVLTIPTVVASFFGMNVPVPLADRSHGFILVVGGTMLLLAVILWIFHRRRWL